MSSTIAIRPLERRDYDQWLPLWAGYNEFYERVGPTAVPDNATETTWNRFFDAYEPVNALVAEQDSRLLGLVHYIYHRSTTSIAPTCYLQDLFTTPKARGAGVGRALIEGVYEKAASVGATRVYWHTHQTNTTAMLLYDKIAAQSGFLQYRKVF